MASNRIESGNAGEPLSIVQMHSHDYGGGAETVARLNHRQLQRLGHKSQLLVARKVGRDIDIDKISYRRGLPGSRRLARAIESGIGLQYLYSPSFREVKRQFRGQPDVLHLHSLHGAEGWADLLGVSRLVRQYPAVFSLHDLWLLTGHCAHPMGCERWTDSCGSCPDLGTYPGLSRDGTRLNWIRKRRLFARHRCHFIVPSEWLANQVKQSPIIGSAKLAIIPNPINSDIFKAGNRATAKARLSISPDAVTVLFAANNLNNEFKGAAEAKQVLNGLSGAKALAIVTGQGARDFSEGLRIPSLSLGRMESDNDLAACYQAADIFLAPSKVETFGLAAAEATACGAVVAGFKAGALQETISKAHGIAVDDADVAELLTSVKHLIDKPRERAARAFKGSHAIREWCGLAAHSSKCTEVYRAAIDDFARAS